VKPRRGFALATYVAISPAQRQGALAEDRACAFLESQGLAIVGRNVRFRVGELDAVARDGELLVFVEIRKRRRHQDAAVSIDFAKRGKIRRAAHLYLRARYPDRFPPCRFDVVLVGDSRIEWLQSAFAGQEE
jgi:putative endonuclease